jgi:phosphohistidine phosphatase SixA
LRRWLLAALAAALLVGPASAGADESRAWRALAEGGVAVLFRHSSTDTGSGESPGFTFGVCATERQLNEAGVAKARRVGEEFRQRAVRVDDVLSSQWCRCTDTARHAFGRATVWLPLNVLNAQFNPATDRDAQSAAVVQRIASIDRPANVVMVTHQLNIIALTGKAPAEGDAVVVRHDPRSGGLTVVGELRFR